jgi:hypothetical protein
VMAELKVNTINEGILDAQCSWGSSVNPSENHTL